MGSMPILGTIRDFTQDCHRKSYIEDLSESLHFLALGFRNE